MTRRKSRTYGIVFTVFLATALCAVIGSAAEDVPRTITQQALLDKLESGAALLILDVRTPREYQSGHVPQAVNIPHTQLANRLAELGDAKDREVVSYCEGGVRAGIAENILRKAGFTAVRHLEGDMAAWRRSGLPMERP